MMMCTVHVEYLLNASCALQAVEDILHVIPHLALHWDREVSLLKIAAIFNPEKQIKNFILIEYIV